jgi:hypothetical protein
MKANAIKTILQNASQFEWSLQGFGMLRLYLSDGVRLHVWDSRYAVPNVSLLHTHPWDFQSEIISGQIRNQIYHEFPYTLEVGAPHHSAVILCGTGGCKKESRPLSRLQVVDDRTYNPGETYAQKAEEIHKSMPTDGCVTLVTRTFRVGDRDHARVFWPEGEEWVSAEPSRASLGIVRDITWNALCKWNA